MHPSKTSVCSIEDEFDRIPFPDKRLSKRLKSMAAEFWDSIGSNIPQAMKGWADIKAAYRFFSNDKVDDSLIQHGHFLNTVERVKQDVDSSLIVVQDTSTLNFEAHPRTTGLGSIGNVNKKRHLRGIHFHSSIVFKFDKTPLGLLEQEVWFRELRENKKDLPKIPVELKESARWRRSIEISSHVQEHTKKRLIVVSDREGDLNHQIIEAMEKDVGFVIRARNKRSCLNENNSIQIKKYLKKEGSSDQLRIEVTSRKKHYFKKNPRKTPDELYTREPEETRQIDLSVHWKDVTVLMKKEDGSRVQEQIGAIWAHEVSSAGRSKYAPLSWLILTNETINTLEEVQRVLNIYKIRWEIEVYHRILKSGCKVEDCRLSDGNRLARYLLVMGVIAWRVQFLTQCSRENEEILAEEVMEPEELLALQLKCKLDRRKKWSLKEVVYQIAILGGFMGRKSDKHPGPMTIWRGLQQLHFITEGLILAKAM